MTSLTCLYFASRIRQRFAYMAIASSVMCFSPITMATDDFEDPKVRIRTLYETLRTDLAAEKGLQQCEDDALKQYMTNKLGDFLSLPNVLGDIGFKLTKERFAMLPEDQQQALQAEFTVTLIKDNLPAIKQVCAATDLKVLSSEVDYTVSLVRTSLQTKGKKPIRVDFLLLRGWDHWLINDILIGKTSLSERYRASLGPTLADEGYAGLHARLVELNRQP
ncbi:ABC transporter substrate-binding protein [Chitinivorax sp. B]|uniref:ABC transporter substrate-binding protein n=1 Tax=Chitinivorax sp. B TaxID=2502235 RepID=UPI0010F52865|nr:ABC transporter substrate-binding protein [Chitinivorax sp. B]